MVSSIHKHPIHTASSWQEWLDHLPIKDPAQRRVLEAAYQQIASPDYQSAFNQGFALAVMLAELDLDTETLAAALVYPAVKQSQIALDVIAGKVSKSVAKRVSGVLQMDAIRSLQHNTKQGRLEPGHIENLRKMLLAMVDDVRVVLIKLVEQLHRLRIAKELPEQERVALAQETADVYAPLANRLGIGQIKWEMEDLSFRYSHPEEYKRLAKSLDERRIDRERYIKEVLAALERELAKHGIKGEVSGRAKHIYSIWRKMQRKHVDFDEIYDVRAVRILVPELQDCYGALGCVHSLWQHIPKEFDDYIATPKKNGYRSLHTAVIGPQGKPLEIQIRTFTMHEESELGVAAHWKYKEGSKTAGGFEAKIAWLRQLLAWQEDVADEDALLEQLHHEFMEERVYVFTPLGDVIDLPNGATPIDFAYHIHSDVGHRCRGAKINGRIVPLTYRLNTGEQIEVLTAKERGPSRDWLNVHSGYVRSPRARSKIQQWFRAQDHDKNLVAGKAMLEKECHRLALNHVDYAALAHKFNYPHSDELYVAVGAGDVGVHQVAQAIQAMLEPHKAAAVPAKFNAKRKAKPAKGILVEGLGNLLAQPAKCCKPMPGDKVIGYVTQGRGVAVHRQNCAYVDQAKKERAERLVNVEWGQQTEHYPVDILVRVRDRQGLLRDLTALLSSEKVDVLSLNTEVNPKTELTDVNLRVGLHDVKELGRLLTRIEQIQHVVDIRRV